MSQNNISKPYESLVAVRKNLRVKWYRSSLDKENLRELTLKNDYQGWIQAGGHFAVFLITGLLTYLFWSLEVWWAFFTALFFHGTVSSFFTGVASHELGHSTVFRNRKLNKVFLYLFSLISWWDHFDYAVSHTYHHRYTMYPEADRENVSPLEPSLNLILLIQLFSINLFCRAGRVLAKEGCSPQYTSHFYLLWEKLVQKIFPVRSGCNHCMLISPKSITSP